MSDAIFNSNTSSSNTSSSNATDVKAINPDCLAQLRQLLKADQIRLGSDIDVSYQKDWSHCEAVLPMALLLPETTQQVADIAVVHNYGDGGTSVGAKLVYQHYTNEKNWIDLNNIGEMTLNRLRVYCSYDNNEPAVGLVDKTDVLVMFRQKPMTDTSVPNQVISNTGVDFYSRDTTTRVA